MCSYWSAESAQIRTRRDGINQLWADLRELADARTQALASAKEIHTFDRDASDCKERIQEKSASLSNDYGKDLASVQALQRKHEGFEVRKEEKNEADIHAEIITSVEH